MKRWRIGVDTGGTFSDFVILDARDHKLDVLKTPSTPRDPSIAVMEGFRRLQQRGIQAQDVEFFCHGTTVGTNALLEGKGAPCGLLLTDGFRAINDVVEEERFGPDVYKIYDPSPHPAVPPRLVREIKERVDFQGNILTDLDMEQARRAVAELLAKGVKSIAVCLLFSFMNPKHEQALREIIRKEDPDCSVSLSCEIIPRIREQPRMSTTVVNARLTPLMATYLQHLGSSLREAGVETHQVFIMQCNGGMATFQATSERAVPTVLSGPAAGVVAGATLAMQAGFPNSITFDMGGTSCDMALVEQGRALEVTKGKVGPWDVAIPMLDVNTISAGGGTVSWVDKAGIFRVGPHSAGADPGPACYGKGGTEPTVTDANLVLGFLNPEYFLAGEIPLYKEQAEQAIREKIAQPLNLDLLRAADGIIRIVNVNMEQGMKAISTERGFDPRDFVLVAFGGAGPVHAARLAADLGIPKVLVPPSPGLTSALGLLLSDVRHDYVRSRLGVLSTLDENEINQRFAEMRERALADMKAEGFSADEVVLEYSVDMRYSGQGYELTVPLTRTPPLAREDIQATRSRFDEQHGRLFGHKAETEPVELVSFRLVARVPTQKPAFAGQPKGKADASSAVKGHRTAYFGGAAGMVECPVYQRDKLAPGNVVPGPAIVEQMDSTTVVYPGQTAQLDTYTNIIISTGEG
ncbi:MAG: hydantoinase/oxoprolinase family protein [Chloroflexi bacterium]|nr:hydantoinase/oxoprolinase family protein [Chloroflexota bacterium]